MSDLRSDVARYIRRERLLEPKQAVRVAVSGGIDSMVLLHLLRSLDHLCCVVHVDHGLRGEESDDDLAFVRENCLAAGIPFASKRVDVMSKARGEGLSTQMAARELRYQWFRELRMQDPQPIALAHHADDAVETLLLGLLRGPGTRGWSSIRPSNDGIIRPLLCVGREAIARYARDHGVAFREDSSNAEPKYLRNRVRNELLPLMEGLRPGALRTMARSLDTLRELESIGRRHVTESLQDLQPDVQGVLRVPFEHIEASDAPLLLLHHLLRHRGAHPEMIDRVREAIAVRATGSVFPCGTWQVTVDREALLISPAQLEWPSYVIDEQDAPPPDAAFTWCVLDGDQRPVLNGPHEALLDADLLNFPLEFRPWRHGDRIRPMGLEGSKLVSDILIDAKVPMSEKGGVYVLVSAGTIVWVSGHRLAKGFGVSPGTKSMLRIARIG